MTLREKEDERRKGKKGERGQGIESRRGNGKDIANICISFYKFRTVCTTRAYYSLFAVLVVEFVKGRLSYESRLCKFPTYNVR